MTSTLRSIKIYRFLLINFWKKKLAGIVLSKLSNVLDYDPSAEKDTKYIKIPVGDAYNSFIANEIIDMKKFGRTDAKPAEQAVYNTFTQKKAEILSELMAQLQNENAPAYKDLSKEIKLIWTIYAILF